MNRNIQKIVNWNFSKLKGISMAEVPVKFPNNYQTITVPHTWYLDDDYYRGVAVYETTISCLPNGMPILNSKVPINGVRFT